MHSLLSPSSLCIIYACTVNLDKTMLGQPLQPGNAVARKGLFVELALHLELDLLLVEPAAHGRIATRAKLLQGFAYKGPNADL
eukprot:COSAG06_NODE_8815_length_2064_cov_3.171501_4_plen_83_part_00